MSEVPKYQAHNNPQILCEEIDRRRILSPPFPNEFEVINLRERFPQYRRGSPIILLKYHGPNPAEVNKEANEQVKMLLSPLGLKPLAGMATRDLKKLRPRGERLPVSNADDHTNDQVMLYRTLAQVTKLPYACPLCLRGYSRYDNLYNHFRTTNEAEHQELKNLWFGSRCPVCSEPSDHILRHTAKRHPTIYQSLMKSTLRIRHEVVTEIPASPECFEHTFLFPIRRRDRIVSLPPTKQIRKSRVREGISMAQGSRRRGTTHLNKRKAENQSLQQDIDDHLEARMEGVAPPSHTSALPGHRAVQVDAAHPPAVGNPIGHDFYTESNPVQSTLACLTHPLSFPSLATLPDEIQEPRIDLSARGYVSHLSTEYQVPWEMFAPTDIHQGDTGDDGQVTRN
ncbi:hypothetical protein AnigIFM63604_003092 [Aspergillus niger]|uniref:C2H2-type domain-containing protein n=1 Tax=Aspergillus niger TaxID=5061 RepID=A0A9W6A8W1_ASPNG|nr:hypothetical protein AnigIFM63604_003092 [Aspergillus niger]